MNYSWAYSLKEIFDTITYSSDYNYVQHPQLPVYPQPVAYAEEFIQPPLVYPQGGEIVEDHRGDENVPLFVPPNPCGDQCSECVKVEEVENECSEEYIPSTLPPLLPVLPQKRRRSWDGDDTSDEVEYVAKRSHLEDNDGIYQTETPLTVQALLGGSQEVEHNVPQHRVEKLPTAPIEPPRRGRPRKTAKDSGDGKMTEFRKKATVRERQRVNTLSEAFAKLRTLIPSLASDRGSQIETLRLATMYIEFLLNTLSEREMYQRSLEERVHEGNCRVTEELTTTVPDNEAAGVRNKVIAREKLRFMFGMWRMDADLENQRVKEKHPSESSDKLS
ncbi:uncharacterized protein LOC129788006 [Lutzomyia longipalpis]|uniref:uncharacterized protein LOC129788006 n=1 Tax=Lutzomyia longipalpis TaxID=7200 RepID=UPI00248360EA|nr:uncharacterized protein LOC129788006 [Lutzomyia longipalpis]